MVLDLGPLLARIRLRHPAVAKSLIALYADFPANPDAGFAHLDVEVGRRPWPFRPFRPQARFISDGHEPFVPLPEAQALPLIEWGLNWTIATRVPNFMIIHAAVVARGDAAIILPGSPGAGKSTLCAALVASGWRLLSDEFALVHPETLELHPIPRPISLKNASIDIIRTRWPTAWHSPPVKDTSKGTVALFKPPRESVAHRKQTATARWVIFPRYTPTVAMDFATIPRARALARLSEHVVNFTELPRKHFGVLDRLFADCKAAELEYSDLDHSLDHLTTLLAADAPFRPAC